MRPDLHAGITSRIDARMRLLMYLNVLIMLKFNDDTNCGKNGALPVFNLFQ